MIQPILMILRQCAVRRAHQVLHLELLVTAADLHAGVEETGKAKLVKPVRAAFGARRIHSGFSRRHLRRLQRRPPQCALWESTGSDQCASWQSAPQ